jgi:hypothetical protein
MRVHDQLIAGGAKPLHALDQQITGDGLCAVVDEKGARRSANYELMSWSAVANVENRFLKSAGRNRLAAGQL